MLRVQGALHQHWQSERFVQREMVHSARVLLWEYPGTGAQSGSISRARDLPSGRSILRYTDRGGRAERRSASMRTSRTPPKPRQAHRLRLKWQRKTRDATV
jgi:hypothetical protein